MKTRQLFYLLLVLFISLPLVNLSAQTPESEPNDSLSASGVQTVDAGTFTGTVNGNTDTDDFWKLQPSLSDSCSFTITITAGQAHNTSIDIYSNSSSYGKGTLLTSVTSAASQTISLDGSKYYTLDINCNFVNSVTYTVTVTRYSGGTGTSSDPFLISTKADLKSLSESSGEWDKNFKQTADITLDDSVYQSGGSFNNGGSYFNPIGNASTFFTGSYDGYDHKITNLKINRGSTDYIGFFGRETSTGSIKNLGLENVNITGGNYTGGLLGQSNASKIFNCYVKGSVSGKWFVGGLVGESATNTISRSYSTGSVSNPSYYYIGGLVGISSSDTISNCYSTSSVNGGNDAGGLIGESSDAGDTVSNCYSTGSVSGMNQYVGGLMGYTYSGAISNSFWNSDSAGTTGIGYGKSTGATAKTASEMRTETTFTNAGWDFTNTWSISSNTNNGYPYLQTVSPMPVELSSFSAKVNGDKVELNWQTATEINNYGFEVERSAVSNQPSANQATESRTLNAESWTKIGFIKGNGNSNSPKQYFFVDDNAQNGYYIYRLKQIDNDGKFKYSKEVELNVNLIPKEYSLSQNYPNPFNPSTTIDFSLPVDSKVVLDVYNILGQKVATLVNGELQAGNHSIQFNTQQTTNHKQLASGVYVYRLSANGGSKSFTQTKKFVLLK